MTASGPLGEDALAPVVEAALSLGAADDVEVSVSHSWGALTRFAASAIHQHVASEDTTVAVRVVVGGRVGTSSTNDATPRGAEAAAGAALAAARLTPPDPTHAELAGARDLPRVEGRYDEGTAVASPKQRAERVAGLLAALRPGQEGAGAVSTDAEERSYATTVGARHYGLTTRAAASTVIMGGGASGHAEDAAVTLDDVDAADVGVRAAATCAAAVDPGDVEPGDYEVVLLPSAVMTLLEHLTTTFSAKAYAEGRSAFSGRLGEAVASPLVSIADDALGPGALGLPFDGEGTPRTRVELITGGVASAVVHDRTSAAAAGVASTGHGLQAPNPYGPVPSSMVLAPGPHSVDDLVAGIDHGLVVTRFWYARTVNPKKTLVTGMTRDGTFRIDGGIVGPPVRNLRWNVSVLDALASCDGVGSRLRTCSDEWWDTRVPALRLRSFAFSSVTDH